MNPRISIIALLQSIVSSIDNSMKFYGNFPPSSVDSFLDIDYPFYPNLNGTIWLGPPIDLRESMSIIKNTALEYIDEIERFSDGEFRAFMLGMGLNISTLEYWGINQLDHVIKQIQVRIAQWSDLAEEEGSKITNTTLNSLSSDDFKTFNESMEKAFSLEGLLNYYISMRNVIAK